MRSLILKFLAVAGGMLLGHAARAVEDVPPFSISGFSTLGAVYHGSRDVEFRRDISEPNGAKGGQVSLAQDSMLGVQATFRPASQFEATAQVLSRHAIDIDYVPQITWAYVKYKPVDAFAIRAGRLGIDLYLQGDTAEIGYANLAIRQPVIFYPRTHDGIDAEYIHPLAAGNMRLKGSLGRTVGKLFSGGGHYDLTGSKHWGLLAEYNQGGWTGRVSLGEVVLKEELSGTNYEMLKSSLSLAPNGAEILSSIFMKNRHWHFMSAALAYDSGPLQWMANYSLLSSQNRAKTQAFFTQLGYRVGAFTPYALYSLQKTDRSLISTGIPWGLSPATDRLNQAGALAQVGNKINQSAVAIGVRYDIARNAALKFQVDEIRYRDPASIIDPSLLADNVENRRSRKLSLFSMAVEFVF